MITVDLFETRNFKTIWLFSKTTAVSSCKPDFPPLPAVVLAITVLIII